ncbi:Hypothetical predicted protein [Mytilus galloprovincialis]|uniref:Uncharacterized protein n=1 Tax=Mytilus galloprovincialis TaxID=29158 RepID=A0A8B6E5F4_MYTGA|nr:Hypothetical predicted protein [Mytilus galloprovincialis]
MNIIQPIVEQRLDMKFPRPISDSIMLSPPVTPKELQSTKNKVMPESRNKINESFTERGNDSISFRSSDVEQSSYTAVRIEDLQILSEPITADNDERVGLIKSTRCFEELKKGNLNPFQNLKKDDLIEELESRDIDIHNMLRPELQENLSALLHGICRPPALMTTNPTLSTHHLNLNNYEIFGMEPLHDLSNFIQNIITELPSHISDKKLQKELEEFSKHTIGDKNQIKGSDARLYLVPRNRTRRKMFLEIYEEFQKTPVTVNQKPYATTQFFDSLVNNPASKDSIYIQESIIQKLAKQIQAKPRTLIPSTILNKRPILLQSHLERISDYILPGEGVWWHMEDGNMIFHDGPDDEPFHNEGPDMHHFRSSSYKEEHQQLKDIWEKVIENYKGNIITLPLQRIKTFDKDGKVVYITPTETDLSSESTDNYQHNIPVQEFQGSSGTIEPANEDQPSTSPKRNLEQDPDQIPDIENELETREERERKLLENNNIKHLYKSHIKVLRWVEQPYSTDAHENPMVKPKKLPAKKPLSCKRKLFDSEISNQEFAPRRKKTTFDLVVQLLGPSSDVDDCIKYRELKLKHPGHKSFVSAFDQSFSKLQIEVSKKYFALKDKTANNDGKENMENLLADKEIAQKLLDHWGVYYF